MSNTYFVPLFFSTNRLVQTSQLERIQNCNFFWHNIVNYLGVLNKKVKFVKLWLKDLNWLKWNHLSLTCDFLLLEGPTNDIKSRLSCRKYLVHSFGEGDITRFPPKQLIRHNFLKAELSKSNQVQSTKWPKVGTNRQSQIWSKFVPEETGLSLLIVVVKDNFA